MSRYTVPPHVAALSVDDVVYVARLPGGPIVVLDGSAAVIWNEAVSGDRRGIAERVAGHIAMPPAELEDAIDVFVAELVERGLLVREPGT